MNHRTWAPLLCAASCVTPALTARAQQAAPSAAFVTAVQGQTVTLGVGAETGAQLGALFQITRGANSVRVQITQIRARDASARIVATQGQLPLTVGDTLRYVGLAADTPATTAPLPDAPTATVPAATAPADSPVVNAPVAPSANAQALPPAMPVANAPVVNAPAADVPAGTPATPPAQVLVTGISGAEGKDVTLGAGLASGIRLGAVYVLPARGEVRARMIVVEVGAQTARARLLNVGEGFVPTVGESARFDGIEAVPADALPAPSAAETPVTGSAGPLVAPAGINGTGATLAATSPGALSGSTAFVTAVDGQHLTLNAGFARGAFVGQNLPILRGGVVIGLVRITAVTADSASALIVYSDGLQGAIAVGDAAGLITAAGGPQPSVVIPAIGIPNQPLPSLPVKFESGASNVAVPKTENTYELLASLAARGLIKSQPARVFQDEGARRHRVAEDIAFSHAQIAGFIVEALGNFGGERGRDSAALSILVSQYRRDLLDLNVPAATLSEFSDKGFQLGISSWTRLSATTGDNNADSRDSFEERFGANRRKSGLDTRTNFFGTLNSKLSFYASLDAGSDIRDGNPFGSKPGSNFRKAYLAYDANSLLRGLSFRLGRQEYWWGPGHYGTGLLSDAAGGLDSLSANFERGSYQLRGVYARLGTGPAGGSRSLYAQDINTRVGKSAKIGVNTSVLLPNDSFDPVLFATAFTPFPLYVSRSSSPSRNVFSNNAVVSGYGEVAVARGARLYGELILDDLALTNNNPIENRDGSIFGLEIKDPKDPTRAGFNFEYGRFNSVAYTNFVGRQGFTADYDYYFRGAPLGYSIAPVAPTSFGGAENIRLEGYLRPLRRLSVFAGLQFADLNAQDQNPPGPFGNSRQRTYRLAVIYDINRRFTLAGRFERVDTDHTDFTKNGPTRRDSLFSLTLGRSF